MSRKKKRKKQKLTSGKRKLPRRKIPFNKPLFDVDSELQKAMQYHKSGQLQKAERIYKKILKINPNHSEALNLSGVIAHQVGNNDTAVGLIKRAIQNDPTVPTYYNNLGIALKAQDNIEEAISSYEKALQLEPDLAEAYYNMGDALQDRRKLEEAISCYQKALQLKPDLAEAHTNMGVALRDKGKPNQAIQCYQKALQLKPDLAEAYYNMGVAFGDQGEASQAISCYQKAFQLNPSYAEAYTAVGIEFKDRGELSHAMSYYQKALQLKPDLAEAHYNMGIARKHQGEPTKAISCFQKALRLKPELAEAYGHLLYQLRQTCSWQELEDVTGELDGFTERDLHSGTKTAESPFISVTRHADLSHNFDIAKSWSSDIARTMSSLGIAFSFDERRSSRRRIIVGYLSNDFHDHATAHLMLSLFGLHNRDAFEIYCYSYGKDDGSYYRARIKEDSDKFVDVQDHSHAGAARCIYEDEVDILVDLKGYTKGSRLGICALRPAPIQVSYLGFPGTTGAEFLDYIITDRIVTPEDHARYYSENFVYLPHCYQVNDHSQVVSDRAWKKSDLGLPEETFLFCSFNRPYKIDPVMFDVWMKVLQQVPQAVLWLQWANETAEKNLKQEAKTRGVNPETLIFAKRLPKAEHLARLALADLALDTRIVNGHTTTSDALWASVPVITLQGSHFASRVSASILTAIGLRELIIYTPEDYEALAVRLARDSGELQAIRQRLAKNRLTDPLFDTPRFVRNLEQAYKEMWKLFSANQKPRQIEVVEN